MHVSSSARLLQPGRNCRCIVHADRFAMLVDGDSYFRALRAAIRHARRSIFILSWDIDSRVRLVPGGARDGYPEGLGDFLYAMVKSHPALQVYILNWNFAMLYALEREWRPAYKPGWRSHPRLQFHMDARHPVGASHHQKVVVIDDALAFVGGLDLTRSRWDTPAHACHSARRHDVDGKPYDPFHDVQAMVDGDAACRLGELARERWELATGHAAEVRECTPDAELWPEEVAPDITDVELGIARTEPASESHAGVYEIRQLYLDAIAQARRRLFFENQYFTSDAIGNALAARLLDPRAPDVAVISPRSQSGWLEQATMGVLRARVHRRLKASDDQGHYRMYCAELPGLAEGRCLNLHSKVFIKDDDLLSIGSANLSNRSMALDTECNLVLEAYGPRRREIRAAISHMQARLLAEHLDVTPAAALDALARNDSLHAAIAELQQPGRTLTVFDPVAKPELESLIPQQAMFDAEQPIDPEALVAQMVPRDMGRPTPRHMIGLGTLAVLLALLAIAWRWTPLGEWVNLASMVKLARSLQEMPFTPLAVIAGYVVAGVLMVPVTLLIGVTGIVFGPIAGALYAIAGTVLSAAVTYGIGRGVGKSALRRLLGPRIERWNRQIARGGVIAMIVMRILPVAPFSVVNLIAGALQVGFRNYLIGTLVGMAPGILVTVTFAHHLAETVRRPSMGAITVLAVVASLLIASAIGLQRMFERKRNAEA